MSSTSWTEADLARLFRDNGEARFARRIARAVVAARPIETTVALAEVVRDAIPAAARRTGGHPPGGSSRPCASPSTRSWRSCPDAIDAALAALVPGGRCAVISYHSGEDRIAKERFRLAVTGGCAVPPGLPCVCGAVPTVRLLTRGARRPTRPGDGRQPAGRERPPAGGRAPARAPTAGPSAATGRHAMTLPIAAQPTTRPDG